LNQHLPRLERALRHAFKDPALLDRALTHRSVGSRNNERLEFLGDSLLNMVIAEALFLRHPDIEEGDLSRLRASLVNQDALAELANELHLGEYLNLGPGEMKSGGQRRASILADTLEAILGAIHLDAGFQILRETILHLFHERLENPASPEELKDAKTRLQEWLQARNLTLPVYQVESVTGEPHRQVFRVSCVLEESHVHTSGEAASRRGAEQEAARYALEALNDE
jgi:ribonuclease III